MSPYAALQEKPEELIQLIEQRDQRLLEKQLRIEQLENIIRSANRAKYGPKTERLTENQLELSFELPPEQLTFSAESEVIVEKHSRVIHQKRGRKPLPDSLPREERIYTPETTHCSCCNAELVTIGEYRTEELEKTPASLKVIEHVRPKMACSRCKGAGVLLAPLPVSVLPLEGARPGAGLLADIVVSKYVDHLPLHRQEEMFKRQGIELSRKRMCDWVAKIVELLTPLYLALKRELLSFSYLQADETVIKVQDGVTPNQGYLWGVHGPPNLIWFHYTETRSGKVPKELLADYKGILQTDAYAGYNQVFLPDSAKRLACLAHIRRKFVEAQPTAGAQCAKILKLISEIYRVEGAAKTPEARLLVRQHRTKPLLEELFLYLSATAERTLPKSPLAQALSYAIKQREEVFRVLEDGVFQLDNNSIERQMKQIAIGRKNYYFAGSHQGANRAAVLYSLLGTCRLNKVNPWEWTKSVLSEVSSHPNSKISELLPHRWKVKPGG